jgi:hypothetical protein
MSREPGLGVGIILVAVAIAAAIMTWAASPIGRADSAGPSQDREAIYRPQHLLVY